MRKKSDMRFLIYKYLLISLILASFHAQAEVQYFSSGEQQSVLVELYTSEGCSSCPPAEEYLNDLKRHPELWQRYIPVAFHVDYWDYIGWQDPYAQPQHGKRQSAYARLHSSRTVYTPAFMVNGKPWRIGWFGGKLPASKKTSGVLKVSVNGNQLSAEFAAITPVSGGLTLNIAVLGMGLESQIMAGENEGRSARHEFVVVGYKALNSVNPKWETTLPDLNYKDAEHYALAVWVNRNDDLTPLQATGGELPDYQRE